MAARRKIIATIAIHQKASNSLLRSRDALDSALEAVDGLVLAREIDHLLKVRRSIDMARVVLETRLTSDHPKTWSTEIYYPRNHVPALEQPVAIEKFSGDECLGWIDVAIDRALGHPDLNQDDIITWLRRKLADISTGGT